MSESNSCRLCVNPSKDYINLYDSSGHPNEVYGISVKYFDTMFLKVKKTGEGRGHQQTVLCLKCWHYILNFYKFQEAILLTQTKLLEVSGSSMKTLVDANSDVSDQWNNACRIVKGEPESTAVPTTSSMYMYSEMPSVSSYLITILDSKNDINMTPGHPKYTENIINISSEDDDEDCDDPVGYFTNANNTTAAAAAADVMTRTPYKLDEIKIESSNSEEDEIAYDDDNDEFLSEDDVNPKSKDCESVSEGTPSLDGKVTRKRKRKSTKKKSETKKLPLLDCLIKYYQPSLQCSICAEELSTFRQLEDHFRQSHPDEQCHIVCCKRKLITRYRVKEHISVHLDRTLFQCNVCKMCQVTKAGLKSHLLRVHGIEMKDTPVKSENTIAGRVIFKQLDDFIAQWRPHLECRVCSMPCHTFTHMQIHFQEHHPDGPECYIECCGHKLYQYHQIEEHVIFHQDPMAFKCQQCNECFTSRTTLYSHSRLQHPLYDEDDDNAAEVRTSKPLHRQALHKIDESIAEFQPELKCYLCQKFEPRFGLLLRHFRAKHPHDKFYVICCKRKFSRRCKLRSHQLHVHRAELNLMKLFPNGYLN